MFKFPELKFLGQRAFISYVRSIHLQKNKEIFKLKELDLVKFAESLGLPGAPQVRFSGSGAGGAAGGTGESAKAKKNAPRDLETLKKLTLAQNSAGAQTAHKGDGKTNEKESSSHAASSDDDSDSNDE